MQFVQLPEEEIAPEIKPAEPRMGRGRADLVIHQDGHARFE
jgi:hypothetical protein